MQITDIEKKWMATFPRKLNLLFKEKNINAFNVSKEIGISETTLYKYLSADRIPKVTTVLRICDYFNVPIEYFIDFDKEMTRREYAHSKGVTRELGIEDMDSIVDEEFMSFIDLLKKLEG